MTSSQTKTLKDSEASSLSDTPLHKFVDETLGTLDLVRSVQVQRTIKRYEEEDTYNPEMTVRPDSERPGMLSVIKFGPDDNAGNFLRTPITICKPEIVPSFKHIIVGAAPTRPNGAGDNGCKLIKQVDAASATEPASSATDPT